MCWVMVKQLPTFFLGLWCSLQSLNLRLLAEDRSVFLDLFDPLDPLCSCGLEGANHESAKELQTPRAMSSAGMMNSCYPLLLAHCCSVFLEAAAVQIRLSC